MKVLTILVVSHFVAFNNSKALSQSFDVANKLQFNLKLQSVTTETDCSPIKLNRWLVSNTSYCVNFHCIFIAITSTCVAKSKWLSSHLRSCEINFICHPVSTMTHCTTIAFTCATAAALSNNTIPDSSSMTAFELLVALVDSTLLRHRKLCVRTQ